MPCTPSSTNASLTSSNLNGLIIASIIFMAIPPHQAPPQTLFVQRRRGCRHDRFVDCFMAPILHVIGLLTMLRGIQALLLLISRHTEAYYTINDLENDPGTNPSIGGHRNHHDDLRPHESEATSIEQPIGRTTHCL